MSVVKDAKLIYVDAIPKDRSGIGVDVPAHVKIEYFDEQGRRNWFLLSLRERGLEQIAALPNRKED